MKRAAVAIGTIAALVGAVASAAAAGGARQAMDEGLAAFGVRRYEEAAAKFEEAAAKARAEGLDPDVARYDRALTILKAGKGAEAAAVFADLLRSSNPRLRESAHYHQGIALTTAADVAETGGELRKAVVLLEEALTAYESAMRIDPDDEDPKVNHELVSRKRARLLAKLQEQERSTGQGGQSQERDAQAGERPTEEPEQGKRPPRQGSPEKEMRPDEARTLLDAMRQQELSQRSRTRAFRGAAVSVEKNW